MAFDWHPQVGAGLLQQAPDSESGVGSPQQAVGAADSKAVVTLAVLAEPQQLDTEALEVLWTAEAAGWMDMVGLQEALG